MLRGLPVVSEITFSLYFRVLLHPLLSLSPAEASQQRAGADQNQKPIVSISSQLHVQKGPVGSFKLAMVGAFTTECSWKWADATNQGFLSEEPVVNRLPSHHQGTSLTNHLYVSIHFRVWLWRTHPEKGTTLAVTECRGARGGGYVGMDLLHETRQPTISF